MVEIPSTIGPSEQLSLILLVALVAACALCVALVVKAVRSTRTGKGAPKAQDAPTPIGQPVVPPGAADPQTGQNAPAPTASDAVTTSEMSNTLVTAQPSPEVPVAEEREAPTPSDVADSPRVIAPEITKEEPRLFAARAAIDNGNHEMASVVLQGVITDALQRENAKVHAEGRLLLAELCVVRDDLTSACEHWQLARELFQSCEDAAPVAQVERLMQKHGCPTDWILNDF